MVEVAQAWFLCVRVGQNPPRGCDSAQASWWPHAHSLWRPPATGGAEGHGEGGRSAGETTVTTSHARQGGRRVVLGGHKVGGGGRQMHRYNLVGAIIQQCHQPSSVGKNPPPFAKVELGEEPP